MAAREEVTTLSERYRQLCGDAAELEKEVAFARALASHDDATWAAVAPETWVGLLRCLQVWAEGNLVNPEVSMPDEVRKVAKGIHEYPGAYGPARVPLRGLVAWLVVGVLRADPLRNAVVPLAGATRR